MDRETIQYALAGVRAKLDAHEIEGAKLRAAVQQLVDALTELDAADANHPVRRRLPKKKVATLVINELLGHAEASWEYLQKAVSDAIGKPVPRSTIFGTLARLERSGTIICLKNGNWQLVDRSQADQLFEEEHEEEEPDDAPY